MWRCPNWCSGKEPGCQWRTCLFNPWARKIPWRRKWQPTPVFLPENSCRQRSLVGYSPWGHKESDMNEQLSTHVHACTHTHTKSLPNNRQLNRKTGGLTETHGKANTNQHKILDSRDGMWREVGGGFRMGNTCTPLVDACWCMAKPVQYFKVKKNNSNRLCQVYSLAICSLQSHKFHSKLSCLNYKMLEQLSELVQALGRKR